MGCSASKHFATALDFADRGTMPFNEPVVVDLDLQLAASFMVTNIGRLRESRSRAYSAVTELAARLQPLSEHLRGFQEGTVAVIGRRTHEAFIAVSAGTMARHQPGQAVPVRF